MDGPSCNSKGRSLSLVIPAYNEEAGIRRAVEEADQALSQLVRDYEIIVVDDGSADRTAEIVREATIGHPRVRLLRHAENQGYSAALRTGFQAATCERVAFTDADCQFHLTDLEPLLALSDRHPIAVGYRLARQDPWPRRFFSRGYNVLVRTMLGTAVRDCDCALKVFQRDALMKLLPETPGFFVNTEMLTRARQLGLPVAEAGVRHRPRVKGCSKVSLADIPRTLSTLLPFWWTRVLFPSPGRNYPIDGPESKAWYLDLGFWTVFIVAVVLFFARMRTPLLEPDEARYAEIPRQMLLEGSSIVPVLHGQPYCHKPPLLYWLIMASYKTFGVEDWAARLVPCVACVLLVLVTYGWGRQVNKRAALISALILCLSSRFLYLGRMVTMDGLLSLWVVSALASAHIALRGPALRRSFWLLSALFCGLGLLTKGPVALVLVAVPLLAWQALDCRTVRARLVNWLAYLAVTVGVALPWYAAVACQVPEFAREFFWTHHVLRFLAPIDHAEPFWFFLPGLALGMFPWALLFVPLGKYLFKKSGAAARRRSASLGFFLLAGLWCLLFFSLGGCKRPSYILPAIPPLALALGSYADVMPFRARRIRFENLPVSWVVSGAATFIVLFFAIQQLLPVYTRKFSMRAQVRPQRLLSEDQQIPVVCYPHGWDSVSFYLRRNDVRVYSSDRRDGLVAELRARPQTLVFVKSEGFLRDLRRALPASLEFVPLGRQGNVTAGIVQSRTEASSTAFACR
ncbi:MAG TPA: glycosyltransferase [Gemmataceae bacterium]|nr:glycosyltransferase [Gemmataceae bacterium]